MTFYEEIDWAARAGGLITEVEPRSLASQIGLRAGDELLAVNGQQVQDVIDVQFYAAEESLELLIKRDDEYLLYEAERAYRQKLGLSFDHPTFDIDIRRCNNLCEFCFVLQMAPKFRRTLYIKDDDYRYSFLFGHYVTLTNLDESDWRRIEDMRLSPLYISVHVTDLEMRRKFLRNHAAPDIMDQLRWLAERGIALHTQVVIVPGFNDGAWLDRSLEDLFTLWPSVRSVSVVPVGLTKHHKYEMRTHSSDEAREMVALVEAAQERFQLELGSRFVYATDEWYLVGGHAIPEAQAYDDQPLRENGLGMVRYFLDDWQQVRKEIGSWAKADGASRAPVTFDRLRLVTGTLFAQTLSQAAAEFAGLTGAGVEVQAVRNERLGETITVAGLLMAEDVLSQLPRAHPGELIVLPRVMFDHPDKVSLDDFSPQAVADALERPVALADLMGDVWDAARGESRVFFRPK
jgi:putative radical SAM enzyme (TIGR03279 family)